MVVLYKATNDYVAKSTRIYRSSSIIIFEATPYSKLKVEHDVYQVFSLQSDKMGFPKGFFLHSRS